MPNENTMSRRGLLHEVGDAFQRLGGGRARRTDHADLYCLPLPADARMAISTGYRSDRSTNFRKEKRVWPRSEIPM